MSVRKKKKKLAIQEIAIAAAQLERTPSKDNTVKRSKNKKYKATNRMWNLPLNPANVS